MRGRLCGDRGTSLRGCSIGVAGVLALIAGTAAAEPQPPYFWTWSEPLGDMPAKYTAVRHIQVKVFVGEQGMTPEMTADRVCNQIVQRGLGAGEVAIFLQDWGRGDGAIDNPYRNGVALVWHEDDALPDPDAPLHYMTPWFSNGIEEARTWFEAFIARYKTRQQLDPTIPDPTRFDWDTEMYTTGCCSSEFIKNFDAITKDKRYSTEPIPGHFDPLTGDPMTLEQLYVAAGTPPYNTLQPIHTSAINREWFKWYARVSTEALSAAMNAAAFEPTRQAWPDCRSFDYQYAGTDGQGDPPNVIRDGWQAGAFWYSNYARNFADFESPVLYTLHIDHTQPGETHLQAARRVHRDTYDAILHSFGGVPSGIPDRIVPWFSLPGVGFPLFYYGPNDPALYTLRKEDIREFLALVQGRGTREIEIWDGGGMTASNWNQFAHAVDQVWNSELLEYNVTVGFDYSGGEASLGSRAYRDPIVLGSSSQTGTVDAEFRFATAFDPQPCRFQVNTELRFEEEFFFGFAVLWARNIVTGDWDAIDAWIPEGPHYQHHASVVNGAENYFTSPAEVNLKITFSSLGDPTVNFNGLVDLVQLVALDPRADFDGTGYLDGDDFDAFVNAFEAGIDTADFDRSGFVDSDDYDAFVAAFNEGC
jgi:hypothetical protein